MTINDYETAMMMKWDGSGSGSGSVNTRGRESVIVALTDINQQGELCKRNIIYITFCLKFIQK